MNGIPEWRNVQQGQTERSHRSGGPTLRTEGSDTVAELMKEAAEAQREVQAKADDPGTSRPGRVSVFSLRDTVAEMTGLFFPC